MPRLCANILALVLVPLLVGVSCDGEAPSVYPLRAHGLTAHWCPEVSEFHWTLDVGLAPYALEGSEPLAWPGNYAYSALGVQSGGGGAGRRGRCCSSNAGCADCPVDPAQQQAKNWRLSDVTGMTDPPHRFAVRFEATSGHLPDRFLPGEAALDVAFRLGPPQSRVSLGCVALPVVETIEAEMLH